MRLKTYTAASANEALQLIRDELGDNAVIVSTETDKAAGQTIITAALDDRFEVDEPAAATQSATETVLNELSDASATLRQLLSRHGVPPHLSARIVTACNAATDTDLAIALERGLREIYRFDPLDEAIGARPMMLVGPPGVGKTVTAAKIAARATMAGTKPLVIATDTVRAGAIGQLEAFTNILQLELITARTLEDLQSATAAARDRAVIIDTAGTNPFDEDAVDAVGLAAKSIGAEPVLVLAAGGDAVEAAEIASAFADVSCARMIATRIDLTRRLGSLLAAADAGRLAFSDVSITPEIANGLSRLETAMLANLLVGMPAKPSGNLREHHE